MGQCLQKNTEIKIINSTLQVEESDFLRLTWKVAFKKNEHFHVLLFDMGLDRWNKLSVFGQILKTHKSGKYLEPDHH